MVGEAGVAGDAARLGLLVTRVRVLQWWWW